MIYIYILVCKVNILLLFENRQKKYFLLEWISLRNRETFVEEKVSLLWALEPPIPRKMFYHISYAATCFLALFPNTSSGDIDIQVIQYLKC